MVHGASVCWVSINYFGSVLTLFS